MLYSVTPPFRADFLYLIPPKLAEQKAAETFWVGRVGGGFIAERGAGGLRVNERIRAREVRVIDDEGNQLGVMSLFDAMKRARDLGVDVVEISPNAMPPVCKLVDYGKFL